MLRLLQRVETFPDYRIMIVRVFPGGVAYPHA